jgi:hypothetical protein
MPLARFAADDLQQAFTLSYDAASTAADITVKLFNVPAGKRVRVDGVKYVNPTGLAANDTNFYTLKLVKGASTVAFSWATTATGGQGALTANTFVDFAGSATDTDKVFAAGDDMSVFLDLTGTLTLPAGRLVIYGRYV